MFLGLIFILGLFFIGAIYYILNLTPKPQFNFSGVSLTSEPVSLELNLNSPDDEIIVFDPDLLISGETTKGSTVILSLFEDDIPLEVSSDGNFSYTLKLDTGYNRLVVTSFDPNGNSKTESRTIYYSKEKIE